MPSSFLAMDMEDSVPVDRKEHARMTMRQALVDGRVHLSSQQTLALRVNALEDFDQLALDLEMLSLRAITVLVLPKVGSVEDVEAYEKLVSAAEEKSGLDHGHFAFVPLLETPESYFNLDSIMKASKRNCCVIVGPSDFCASIGGDVSDSNFVLTCFEAKAVLAAKAGGLDVIAGPFLAIDNLLRLEVECEKKVEMGFDGMAALTPRQAEVIRSCFTPKPDWNAPRAQVMNNLQRSFCMIYHGEKRNTHESLNVPTHMHVCTEDANLHLYSQEPHIRTNNRKNFENQISQKHLAIEKNSQIYLQ